MKGGGRSNKWSFLRMMAMHRLAIWRDETQKRRRKVYRFGWDLSGSWLAAADAEVCARLIPAGSAGSKVNVCLLS